MIHVCQWASSSAPDILEQVVNKTIKPSYISMF